MISRPKSRLAIGVIGNQIVFITMASIFVVSLSRLQTADCIFNCFTPNMFKMAKVGVSPTAQNYQQYQPQQMAPYGPDRAHWYPRSQQPVGYPNQPQIYPMSYGYYPMKSMFGTKLRGSSLFGPKRWMNWRTGANNFYRPGYGYMMPALAPSAIPSTGYSPQFSELLNIMDANHSGGSGAYTVSNDGWSVSTVPGYGGYSRLSPNKVNSNYDGYAEALKQQLGSYTNSGSPGSSKYGTKSVLVADGGYSSFGSNSPVKLLNNSTTYGYSYPDWYTTVATLDSPAKIAQQLLKQGLKKRQLVAQQNKSAPLVASPGSSAQFTMLDEPKFVGLGVVELLNNKEARLSCSFGEAIDQTNAPVWVKFSGPYNSTETVNGKIVPPFNCANSLCRIHEIDNSKDYRYKFDNGPATSTLIISEPRLSDYAIYRCSALTKTINNNPIETIYQIVRFGNL